MTLDLVCAGNLLVDDIATFAGAFRQGEAGGAMLYAALGASLWGTRVGLVTVRGTDYPEAALQALGERGVDLAGVRASGRPGLRNWLLYERLGRRELHQLTSPPHLEACPQPGDFPPPYLEARAFHVTPMPLARQQELVAFLEPRRAQVTLDPLEAVREDNLEAWRQTLGLVHGCFVSHEDLQLLGAAADPRGAMRRLAAGNLAFVALKQGERGGLFWDVQADRFTRWSGAGPHAVDPTGAGDAFAGGFLAGRLRGERLGDCLARAAVSACYAVEEWGMRALARAPRAEAEHRLAAWPRPEAEA
jgi:sugar/nucleoside kinase (ribokinase family)